MPRGGNHETISPVTGLKESEQAVATEGRDSLLCPENGKSEGMVLPEHPLEKIMDKIVGGIFDHPDLLENDRSLPADLGLVETGPGEDIGQQIDGQL